MSGPAFGEGLQAPGLDLAGQNEMAFTPIADFAPPSPQQSEATSSMAHSTYRFGVALAAGLALVGASPNSSAAHTVDHAPAIPEQPETPHAQMARQKTAAQCARLALARPKHMSLYSLNNANVSQKFSYDLQAIKGCKDTRVVEHTAKIKRSPKAKWGEETNDVLFDDTFRTNLKKRVVGGFNQIFRKCGVGGYDKKKVLLRASVKESYPKPSGTGTVSKTYFTRVLNLCKRGKYTKPY